MNVEFLPEAAPSYVIEATNVNPIIRSYVGGSAKKQFAFVLASRDYCGLDNIENIESSGFFEDFADWLDDCTREGRLPELGEGKTPQKIYATTPGYVLNMDESRAIYQIQCNLEYIQE